MAALPNRTLSEPVHLAILRLPKRSAIRNAIRNGSNGITGPVICKAGRTARSPLGPKKPLCQDSEERYNGGSESCAFPPLSFWNGAALTPSRRGVHLAEADNLLHYLDFRSYELGVR
jgi:hypothetical protein